MSAAPRQPGSPPGELYIGLMSGTSMDGVDGVLVRFLDTASPPSGGESQGRLRLQVLAHVHRPFPADLAAELLALNSPGANELHRAQLSATALARVYAQVVHALTEKARVAADDVRAVAVHGQTLRHQPGAFDGLGYTVQLNHPALLAELCGVDVIADFRSRDIAAGGQGAPLVPAFHRQLFGQGKRHDVAVLNLGGISNLTLLSADGGCLGFDCGPGNALMDHWCRTHTGAPYDDAGRWAATGQVAPRLLQALLAEPYFQSPPPKSTGRDLFNPVWLQTILGSGASGPPPPAQDVQATLLELTVQSCVQALQRHLPRARELYVCGGGAFNQTLMARFAAVLPGVAVATTAALGLPADQVEAAAFAWLGWAHCHRVAGNLPAVTGASGPRILGALYPGPP